MSFSPPRRRDDVPTATLERLPLYLQVLGALADQGVRTVSSQDLAERAGVTSAKLRKDLSFLGTFGTRGVGYDVAYLHRAIGEWLGVMEPLDVVIVGIGNLGHALATYRGFDSRGFRIVALIDIDPSRVGLQVECGDGHLRIRPLADLAEVARSAQIGVIATPDNAAQSVCDRLVAAGVRSILTFAPRVLVVPEGVEVRRIDLGVELQILAFRERRPGAVSA
ncbi:MAG: redox-sensing transcriptional repressor Rex [Candidatus Nanopelagicales bacterium]